MKARILALHIASLSFLAACGGSTPPADSPAAEASATPSAAPSASADIAAAPSAAPSDAPAAAPSAAPVAAPAPTRTPPTLQGKLIGKPFNAVAACVIGADATKPGVVTIEIYDVKDFDVQSSCGKLAPTPGSRKFGLAMPWAAGTKFDVSTLKVGKNGPEGYVMAATGNPKKFDRKDASKDWKPKGTIEVLRSASKKGDVGRIKITMTTGADKFEGEVDVDLVADLAGQ